MLTVRLSPRLERHLLGIVSLIQKSGLGLAAAALGESLATADYRPNTAQTPATLADIKFILIGLPLSFNLVTFLAVLRYPIDERLHPRLRRALLWRDARTLAA